MCVCVLERLVSPGFEFNSFLLSHASYLFLVFEGSTKPSRALLVHFRSRRDPVDGHKQELPRPHYGEYSVDVLEDAFENFALERWRWSVFRVEARVNDAVHIQV